jgi:clan AA aspartic protease
VGTFSVAISVTDTTGGTTADGEALVDTGATNTVIPGDLLRRLGVQPYSKSVFQLADGREVELDVGRAWIAVDGRREFTQVVFGDPGTEPILGAVTLEEMGLGVDPVAKRLIPVKKYLMRLGN